MALPLALAVEPPTDDQLLAVAVLDLHPGAAAPARLVMGVELLGHHSLEPSAHARLEHRGTAALLVGRRLPGGAGELELLEFFAPLRIRNLQQGVAVEPQ